MKLHELVLSGQARIAPAVAIPQRIRSHFEAQDLLETGGAQLYASTTGWLNRTLQAALPGRPIAALSIGAQEPLILRGPVQAQSWSPGGRLNDQTNRVANTLMDLYAGDPLLGPALATGLQTEAEADVINGGKPLNGADVQASTASTPTPTRARRTASWRRACRWSTTSSPACRPGSATNGAIRLW